MQTKFQPSYNFNQLSSTALSEDKLLPLRNEKKVDVKGERYIVECKISESHYLKEYLAFDTKTRRKVLMKRYHEMGEGIPQEAVRQITALQSLGDTSNIQQIVDIYTREKELILVFEHFEVTLDSIFQNETYYKINEHLARVYAFQILKALQSLHQNKITHNNICLRSFYVGNTGSLILGKFEKCSLSYVSSQTENEQLVSTISERFQTIECNSLAPELILGQTYPTFASDIWAAGCLIFHFLTGYHPFNESTMISKLFRIFKTLGTPTMNLLDYPSLTLLPQFSDNYEKFPVWNPMPIEELLPNCSDECKNFVLQMLQIEPTRRMSAKNLLKHKFMSSINETVLSESLNQK
eukprot:403369077